MGGCGPPTGSQWIATGISQCPRDDKRGESAGPKVNLFFEQIPQDFFGQSFVYLSMAGNGLGQTLIRVMINIVLGSVPKQLATTFLELLDESDSLHATSS
jgi:hypothetical protein